jgi:hypothetical protein
MKIVPPKGGSPEVGMFGDEGVAVAGEALRDGDAGKTADPPPPHAALVNAATKANVTILTMVQS